MKNFTDITFILDRSGSMQSLVKDVVGGYTAFLHEQQRLGDNASMSLVQFSSRVRTDFTGVPIREVKPNIDFDPYGTTSLLDAVGETIVNTGARLAALPEAERPDKVLVVIFTDGEENSSRTYTYEQIKQMIEHQQSVYNWTFLFLGANIDAASAGQQLGIPIPNSVTYAASGTGTKTAHAAVSAYAHMLRSFGPDALAEQTLTMLYEDKLANTTK